MTFTQYEEAQFQSIMLGGDGKLSDLEAEALRKAREHEAEQDKQMAANAHDKITGAL